ncbi:MAG: hypothetical protein WBW33_27275 [Bryobacteraceae bacterium]
MKEQAYDEDMNVSLLRVLGLLIAALALALGSPQDDSRSPLLTPEQNTILDRVRAYATNYTASLPNFVCIEETHRMTAEAKRKPWKPIDQITQKLNYVSGTESYELVSHDRPKKPVHTPLSVISRGEFGTLMRVVLVKNSANFGWLGWDQIQGHKVAIFAYRVPLSQTSLRIQGNQTAAMVAFHGLISALPDTGAVYRITSEAEDIPREMAFQRMGSDMEYGPVVINGQGYLLPVKTILSSAAGASLFRNQSDFRDYQKFGSDSTITFQKDQN